MTIVSVILLWDDWCIQNIYDFTSLFLFLHVAMASCDSFLRILFPHLDRFRHCDSTCTYSEWSQWQRVPNSNVNVAKSRCNSGQAYSERRSQSASERGCNPKLETQKVCKYLCNFIVCKCIYVFACVLYMYPAGILDREDTLIYSLGLGSTGYDYSIITPPPSPPSNTTRRKRNNHLVEYRCPANETDGFICPSRGIQSPIHVNE